MPCTDCFVRTRHSLSTANSMHLYSDTEKAADYRNKADQILASLATPEYSPRPEDNEGFILRHSTGHHPGGSEIDVPLAYADYYYLEALLRKRNLK